MNSGLMRDSVSKEASDIIRDNSQGCPLAPFTQMNTCTHTCSLACTRACYTHQKKKPLLFIPNIFFFSKIYLNQNSGAPDEVQRLREALLREAGALLGRSLAVSPDTSALFFPESSFSTEVPPNHFPALLLVIQLFIKTIRRHLGKDTPSQCQQIFCNRPSRVVGHSVLSKIRAPGFPVKRDGVLG